MPGTVIDPLPELSSLISISRLIYRTPSLARIHVVCFMWGHLNVTWTPWFQSLLPFFRWGNGSESRNNLPTSRRLIGELGLVPNSGPRACLHHLPFASCFCSLCLRLFLVPPCFCGSFFFFFSPQSCLHLPLTDTYGLYFFLTWQSGSSGFSLNFSIDWLYSLSPTRQFSNFNSRTLCKCCLCWLPVKQFHFLQDLLSIACACWHMWPWRLRSYSLF